MDNKQVTNLKENKRLIIKVLALMFVTYHQQLMDKDKMNIVNPFGKSLSG